MPELECFACGKTFGSVSAEAKHRHNFPALCRRNTQFAAFMAEYNPPKAPAATDTKDPTP